MINFVGNIQSKYGRGKDKTKRKSRVNPLVGAGLGTVAGGPVGTIAGGLIARGVNKERDRFDKEGARSHLGKIGHDAVLGAKSLGVGSAITSGLMGAAIGSQLPTYRKKGFLGLGRDKKQEAKDRLKNTLMGAGLGVLGGGVAGAINGAGTGALVGAGRGFVQENRMGKKKKAKFSYSDFGYKMPFSSKENINNIVTKPLKVKTKGVNLLGQTLGTIDNLVNAKKQIKGKALNTLGLLVKKNIQK